MSYLSAWLSLIGWNEVAFLVALSLVLAALDRAILWHEKRPWRGILRRKQ